MSEDSNRATPPPALSGFAQLLRYLNERKMVQWTIAYVALAYSIQHGVVLTGEAFEWPRLVARITMLLFILGLPVAMTIAWYHGDRGRQNVSGSELTIISLLMVIGSALFLIFVRPAEQTTAASAPAVQQASVTAARNAAASPKGAISIAVLPFLNLSSDKEQEFFSDGMTEEITSALAKVPDLRVLGRTSAFQFKGQNKDLRAIGQALGATHLIEGSVRKEGTRVRITAQLIEADNGAHVWTESYDRELTGVFVIQEDIATAIAGALRMPLGLAPGERLVANRSADPDAYQDYLRARTIVRNRNLPEMRAKGPDAIKMLEQVVVRDPSYAPAWGLLALVSQSAEKKEMAAREAIQLDPRNGLAYTALGGLQGSLGNWAATEDLRRKAIELDPNDPEALDIFSNGLAFVGHSKEALASRERLRILEPFAPIYNYITANIMMLNGRGHDAIPILESLPSERPRNIALAQIYAAEGRYGKAADTLLLATTDDQAIERQSMEAAARLLRNAPAKVKAPESLPAFDLALSFVYLYVGAPDRVLDYQERQVARFPRVGYAQIRYLWGPEYSVVRKTERFKNIMRKLRFVEYWRARGWPDVCHPSGADDFTCV